MPMQPPHPCNQPGCGKLVHSRYCDKHAKQRQQAQDRQRGTAHQRGYTARWSRARRRYLNQNPLCIKCMANGKAVAATVVDHIKPHKGDQVLFWDISNWQSLCKTCHDTKTATEDGGFGR